MIQQFSDGIGEALNIDSQNLNNLFTSFDEGITKLTDGLEETKLTASDVLEFIGAAAAVTKDIFSSVYQANIEELQGQLDKSNEYYDNEITLAEGDQVKQDLLREKKRKKEKEIQKQIAKEKTKAAKADKTAAIVQASINTALGVTKALGSSPPPLNFILAALVGALGIAQVGLIASKPIPKFKDGHLSGTYEGWALTNDGGRDEVHRKKDGSAYVIKGRNVLTHMDKGDRIYKSEDNYRNSEDYQKLFRASILTSLEVDKRNLDEYQARQVLINNDVALREEMALTRKAIEKNKTKVIVHQTPPPDYEQIIYAAQKRDFLA